MAYNSSYKAWINGSLTLKAINYNLLCEPFINGEVLTPFILSFWQESNGSVLEDSTTDIAQMLGMIDPWYERNVLSLLSLSSDVLCQVPSILASSPFSGPYGVVDKVSGEQLM